MNRRNFFQYSLLEKVSLRVPPDENGQEGLVAERYKETQGQIRSREQNCKAQYWEPH